MATNNEDNYSPTNHAVQVGGASGTLTSLTVGANFSALQGSTGADPAFTTTPRLVGLGIGADSTGTGLTFDGSSTLANYAIGTFTPGVAFGGGTTGITYSTQVGFYTRIGNAVFFSLNVVLTSKGSSTGTLTVTGLPFTAATQSTRCTAQVQNVTFAGNYLSASVTNASTNIGITRVTTGTGTSALTDTAFANNSTLLISGFFYV